MDLLARHLWSLLRDLARALICYLATAALVGPAIFSVLVTAVFEPAAIPLTFFGALTISGVGLLTSIATWSFGGLTGAILSASFLPSLTSAVVHVAASRSHHRGATVLIVAAVAFGVMAVQVAVFLVLNVGQPHEIDLLTSRPDGAWFVATSAGATALTAGLVASLRRVWEGDTASVRRSVEG